MNTFRSATWDDFQSILDIIRAQILCDYDAHLSEDALRQNWQERNLADSTWLMVNSENTCIAYAELDTIADAQYFVLLYLHSGYQKLHIARSFLEHIETQFSSNEPITIKTRVSSKNETLMQLFQNSEYTDYLSFLTMEIHLDNAPEIPQLPAEIMLREFIAEQDTQAVYEVDEIASRDKGYSKPMTFEQWSQRMNLNGDNFNPKFWHLACHNNEVVGVALNIHNPKTNTAWIDHLGVLPDWRKKGLGRVLLQKSFATFFEKGITHIKLNVDSGSLTNAPRLYENVGMKTIYQYHFFQKAIDKSGI